MLRIPVESAPLGSLGPVRPARDPSGSPRSERTGPRPVAARPGGPDPGPQPPRAGCRPVLAAIGAGLIVLGAATDVGSLPLGDSARHFDRARSSFIPERRTTLAPMGHVVFCLRHADQCRAAEAADAEPVDLTPERLALLKRVNAEVNRAIRPRPDRRGPGIVDQWSLAPAAGDCEDYALTKQHRLQAEGWPASALRLATARTPEGEGHAVLIVRTAAGDWVLDNRTGAILPWTATDLSWIAIQSGADPRLWHAI